MKTCCSTQSQEKMKYIIIFLLSTVSLAFWHSADAQGSSHFQPHAMQPPPMPHEEYSVKSRSYRLSSSDVVTAFK
jgi:hypothetical protein